MLMEEKRAFRLGDGTTRRSTTVRLEMPFWKTLERMAADEGLTMVLLISRIDSTCRGGRDTDAYQTLASCLRVACLTWLSDRERST